VSPQPNRRRNEIPPLAVRLSPAERAELEEKARAEGVKLADLIRAAIRAYQPRRSNDTDGGER